MDRVCHFEISYEQKSRAEKFYSEVFDWRFKDADTEAPYSFAITTPVDEQFRPKESGGINGGMYARTEGACPTPVIVIEVDSCEQRLADVAAAGGSHVAGPFEILGKGVYAQVRDTEGNVIGLWQSLSTTS